ncbi:hypothetical protein [Mycoplasma phocoeninasale]|uniref:hypothetical protein n=1 Tax=Mycoplasma phocoeninasale TaxID=2726117 RepID=UPI0019677C4F|nr:hypothetical protein [Mycoplasma phocoeninasale]MBN0970608.1 hypothetical protein [Mycoplasma phocoeninasale]
MKKQKKLIFSLAAPIATAIAMPLIAAACTNEKDTNNEISSLNLTYKGKFDGEDSFSMHKIEINDVNNFKIIPLESQLKFNDKTVFAKLVVHSKNSDKYYNMYVKFVNNDNAVIVNKIEKSEYDSVQDQQQKQHNKKDEQDKNEQQDDNEEYLNREEFEKIAKFSYVKNSLSDLNNNSIKLINISGYKHVVQDIINLNTPDEPKAVIKIEIQKNNRKIFDVYLELVDYELGQKSRVSFIDEEVFNEVATNYKEIENQFKDKAIISYSGILNDDNEFKKENVTLNKIEGFLNNPKSINWSKKQSFILSKMTIKKQNGPFITVYIKFPLNSNNPNGEIITRNNYETLDSGANEYLENKIPDDFINNAKFSYDGNLNEGIEFDKTKINLNGVSKYSYEIYDKNFLREFKGDKKRFYVAKLDFKKNYNYQFKVYVKFVPIDNDNLDIKIINNEEYNDLIEKDQQKFNEKINDFLKVAKFSYSENLSNVSFNQQYIKLENADNYTHFFSPNDFAIEVNKGSEKFFIARINVIRNDSDEPFHIYVKFSSTKSKPKGEFISYIYDSLYQSRENYNLQLRQEFEKNAKFTYKGNIGVDDKIKYNNLILNNSDNYEFKINNYHKLQYSDPLKKIYVGIIDVINKNGKKFPVYVKFTTGEDNVEGEFIDENNLDLLMTKDKMELGHLKREFEKNARFTYSGNLSDESKFTPKNIEFSETNEHTHEIHYAWFFDNKTNSEKFIIVNALVRNKQDKSFWTYIKFQLDNDKNEGKIVSKNYWDRYMKEEIKFQKRLELEFMSRVSLSYLGDLSDGKTFSADRIIFSSEKGYEYEIDDDSIKEVNNGPEKFFAVQIKIKNYKGERFYVYAKFLRAKDNIIGKFISSNYYYSLNNQKY